MPFGALGTRKELYYARTPFDALKYGTCVGWYDFADNRVCLNSSGVQAADGDGIDKVVDKSPKAWDATQTTSASRPLYKLGIKNGLSIARFDGTNDYFTLASSRGVCRNIGAFTCVAVFSLGSSAFNTAVFDVNDNVSVANDRFVAYLDTTSDTWSVGTQRVNGAAPTYRSGSNATEGTWYIGVWLADYTNAKSEVWANGVTVVSNGASSDAGTTSDTDAGVDPQIGVAAGASDYWAKMDLGELCLYQTLLTANAINAIAAELRDKWAISF